MKKVILGLSGGVDSALTAHLLKEQGYDVLGVYLENGSHAAADAEKVARDIGIGFMTVDIGKQLNDLVIRPFIDSYLQGKTPIPCIICNPYVKFKTLFDIADNQGAPLVATGHYARILPDTQGGNLLAKARSGNDQSYMLYRVPTAYLNRLLLPLGEYATKEQVRQNAAEAGIHIAKKADSMEICFVPNDDHVGFMEQFGQIPPPGDFVDEEGKVLGRHLGIHHYTVGQRRGLNIPAASRLFVTKIHGQRNQIVLSDRDLHCKTIMVDQGVTIEPRYAAMERFSCTCKVRHSKTEYPAIVTRTPDGFTVVFDAPARAPAPGQSAVFYHDDIVIGGGFIL